MTDKQSSVLIDTSYTVETPEGVELVIVPAGVGPRALAYSLDFAIRAGVILVASIGLTFAGKFGTGIIFLLYFLAEWFYPVVFEVFKQGATPGKRTMGLQVVHDDGTPLNFSSSMLRNLLRFVDFMPFGYFLGLISVTLNRQYKRLGDLAAGTVVVYLEELDVVAPGSETSEAPFSVPRQIQELSFPHQQAVVEFGERSDSLSVARQEELAGILSPVLECSGQEAREILKRSADKLIGR